MVRADWLHPGDSMGFLTWLKGGFHLRSMPAGRLVSILLMAVLVAAVLLPAPWRIEVVNDEMLHLKSWRNRYGTPDIFPLFLQKLEAQKQFSPDRLAQIRSIYLNSQLVQRAMLVIPDGHPPLWPVLAELIEALTRSSLLAIRLLSLAATLGTLVVLYRLGVALSGAPLGLWLFSLTAVSHVVQVWAGIGRSYPLAEFALAAAILGFVRDQKDRPRSPGRFLSLALFSQGTIWVAWPILVGPVLLSILRAWLSHRSVRKLLVQTWWYAAASLLLLVYMRLQLLNPSIAGLMHGDLLSLAWHDFSVGGPFGHLASFGQAGEWAGGILAVGLLMIGIVGVFGLVPPEKSSVSDEINVLGDAPIQTSDKPRLGQGRFSQRCIQLGLLLALGGAVYAVLNSPSAIRKMIVPMAVFSLFIGIGLDRLTRRPAVHLVASLLLLGGLTGLSLFHPLDPYAFSFSTEMPFSVAASQLKSEMKPGDTWAGCPYSLTNGLYRFGPLPEPAVVMTPEETQRFVAARGDRACYLFGYQASINENLGTSGAKPDKVWRYMNGYVLSRFDPIPPTPVSDPKPQ